MRVEDRGLCIVLCSSVKGSEEEYHNEIKLRLLAGQIRIRFIKCLHHRSLGIPSVHQERKPTGEVFVTICRKRILSPKQDGSNK